MKLHEQNTLYINKEWKAMCFLVVLMHKFDLIHVLLNKIIDNIK